MKITARRQALGEVQDSSLSNTFVDTLSNIFKTAASGAVQYQLNKQAIQSGQPIVGTTQGVTAAPAPAVSSNNKVLLGVAAGLAGLLVVMRMGKRR